MNKWLHGPVLVCVYTKHLLSDVNNKDVPRKRKKYENHA